MVRGKRKSARKSSKAKATPKLNFDTIGVRFLSGVDIVKIYTYKVRKGSKVLLGQELIADTPRGPGVCAVVRIDSSPQAPAKYIEQYGSVSEAIEQLKFIERKAVPL